MAIDVFIPAKLDSEKARFKSAKGNIKIDYRDTTNITEPYLLSTPYRLWERGVVLDVASPIVLTDPHVTGDNTNYRRFGTDVMFQVSDYQTNVLFLLSDYVIFEVLYEKTEFVKTDLDRFLRHSYKVTQTNLPEYQTGYLDVNPLSLETSELTTGFVDKIPTIIFKKNVDLFPGDAALMVGVDPEGATIYTISYDEDTVTDYGDDGTILDPGLISTDLKNLSTFSANSSFVPFTSNLYFVSSFTNNGIKLVTSKPTVLTDQNPNYTLYSKTIPTDTDIIGFTFNLSPELGALLHVSVETVLGDLSEEGIGRSDVYFNPVYTGQLASEFGLFNILLPTLEETITLTVNGNDTILGSFKEGDNLKFIEALQKAFTPLNVTVLECESDNFILDNKSSTDYDITISSESVEFILKSQFTSFKFPNSTSPVVYNPDYHIRNYSLSHIPERILEDVLEYKFRLTKNTRSSLKYVDTLIDFIVKADQVSGKTVELIVKLNTVEDVLTVTFLPEDTTVDAILSKLVLAFSTILGADIGVVANNLASSISISNLSVTDTQTIEISEAEWYSIDSKNGVLQDAPEEMFKVQLIPVSGG